jgi:uncharacterized repeat protein (TIGR02543 family)
MSVFALWTAATNAVAYDDSSATTAHVGGASTYLTGASFALPTSAPVRSGYSFTGWLMTGANVVSVSLAASAASAAPSGYGDVTVTAQWTSTTPPPVVTPPSSGGSDPEAAGPAQGGSAGSATPTTVPTVPAQQAGSALTSSTSIQGSSLNLIANERFAGFAPSAGIGVGVTGVRTVGQFVLTPTNLTDSVGIAAALAQSMQQDGTSFAQIMSFSVSTATPSGVFGGALTPEVIAAFTRSGLSSPRSVQELNPGGGSWVQIIAHLTGYVPGSTVFLIVTSQPTILGSATVDDAGEAQLAGYLPLGGLELGAHNVRVVGTRQITGVRSDAAGQIQLSDASVAQIRQFDQGTTATVVLSGATASNGKLTAIREVYLDKDIAWWTIYLSAIVALLALLSVLVRRPARRTRLWVASLVSLAAAIPATVIGWATSSYELWWAIPIGLAVPVVCIFIVLARTGKPTSPTTRTTPLSTPALARAGRSA